MTMSTDEYANALEGTRYFKEIAVLNPHWRFATADAMESQPDGALRGWK